MPRTAFSFHVRTARRFLVFTLSKNFKNRAFLKAPFVPWYIEIEEKNTCLQSPIIALKYIKNSAWAILKLYRKTGVRKGLLRVIYTTIASVTQAQFSPVFRRNSTLKKALWYTVSPYETTLRGR